MAIVRECAHRFEAETIRIRLAHDGITALITGTDSATALSMGGAGTDRLVRVEVAADDHPRALGLLQADEVALQQAGPWVCHRCHEQNEPAFEVCWSCSKPRNDDDLSGRRSGSNSVSPTGCSEPVETIVQEDLNPYRPVLIRRESASISSLRLPEEATSQAKRALLASIAGAILFPPLTSFYSVYLLLQLNRSETLSDPVARHQVTAAWAINAVMIPTWILMWCFLF
jgi:hypothetical protein